MATTTPIETPSRVPLPAATEQPTRARREELQPDECLCTYCPAKCCKYFALPIETPTTWADFEYIHWFLLHERAGVFTEEGDWYLLVHTRCKHLRNDSLCAIYERRPKVCRSYSTRKCEYDDDWVYDHYFETSEQVEEYAEAVLGPRKGHGIRSPKPEVLRVVGQGESGQWSVASGQWPVASSQETFLSGRET
jgi:Fe-S-cluster containining protein